MRILALLLVMGLLSGCAVEELELERGMELRSKILKAEYVEFDADITADYGDKLHRFSMMCRGDSDGTVHFTVTAPETIAGISGVIDSNGGKITFDDVALAFGLLADGRLTPVSAPWILVHTLHYGYIVSCAQADEGLMLSINNSYEDDALNLSVYLGQDGLPVGAEIFNDGSRILSLSVNNFTFQ